MLKSQHPWPIKQYILWQSAFELHGRANILGTAKTLKKETKNNKNKKNIALFIIYY